MKLTELYECETGKNPIYRNRNLADFHTLKYVNWLENRVSKFDELEDKLQQILNWINAYPLEVFPEPDFKKAGEILKEFDISISAISASNMRYVLEGIKRIIENPELKGE